MQCDSLGDADTKLSDPKCTKLLTLESINPERKRFIRFGQISLENYCGGFFFKIDHH